MDEMAAVQQALQNLREDLAASEARTRDSFTRHADDDSRRFNQMTEQIEKMNLNLAQWTGALRISKLVLGICLPLILGAVLAHLLRHWNG